MKENTEKLLAWYDKNRRILPWREDPTPYHVWLSEIMLQQTRVEAVKNYYAAFTAQIPDIAALAETEDDRLMKLWEGLGYYSRARSLKKAAQIIQEQYQGRMPDAYEEILTFPGIGSYTAGAVSSIAFGGRQPAVDGNVLRVLTRLYADGRDVSEEKTKREIRQELLSLSFKKDSIEGDLPEEADLCGRYNQALMDLGATICLPNGGPKCEECPWKTVCRAHALHKEEAYPVKKPKKPRRIEKRTILLLLDHRKVALCKRPAKGLLAGMYEFINLEGSLSQDEVRKWLKDSGISAIKIRQLPEGKHIFSHIEWNMTGYEVRVDELSDFRPADLDLLLADQKALKETYAIPSAYKLYTSYYEVNYGK